MPGHGACGPQPDEPTRYLTCRLRALPNYLFELAAKDAKVTA